MTIIGMYDTVPLIHEAKKSGSTLVEFLRGMRQENAFAARSNVLLLGAELSDLGLSSGEQHDEKGVGWGGVFFFVIGCKRKRKTHVFKFRLIRARSPSAAADKNFSTVEIVKTRLRRSRN